MTVWLAAIFTLGLYACAVPVKFALLLRLGGRASFGAGTSVFEGRFALRKARLRASGRKKHLPWRRAGLDLEKFQIASILLRRLLRDARLEQLRLSGRIGFSDAAKTALACGIVRAAEAALDAALSPGAIRFDVAPDFSGGGCELTAWCMISISAGQIILNALRGAIEFASEAISNARSRRSRTWTGIPLRTS